MEKCSKCKRQAVVKIESGEKFCTFHFNKWIKEKRILRKLEASKRRTAGE